MEHLDVCAVELLEHNICMSAIGVKDLEERRLLKWLLLSKLESPAELKDSAVLWDSGKVCRKSCLGSNAWTCIIFKYHDIWQPKKLRMPDKEVVSERAVEAISSDFTAVMLSFPQLDSLDCLWDGKACVLKCIRECLSSSFVY